MSISDHDLKRVNDERRRRGQQPLSRQQAVAAIERRSDNDTSGTDFLLGLCGVPWPSIAGMVGYAIHESGSHSATAHVEPASFTGGGGDFGGGGSSYSYDSGSSSSDSNSSSSDSNSSSYDGGSSSSSSSD